MKIYDNGEKGFFVKCDENEKADLIVLLEGSNETASTIFNDVIESIEDNIDELALCDAIEPSYQQCREWEYETRIPSNDITTILKALQSHLPELAGISGKRLSAYFKQQIEITNRAHGYPLKIA